MIEGLQEGAYPSIAPVLKHFETLLGIPRKSEEEQHVRAYLQSFAEQHGFKYEKDEKGNFIMTVPATPGYENKPAVVLQAHMDMVCIGGNDKNPTQASSDGEWVQGMGTTLGADNGIGLSMAMAAAENTSIAHGPFYILATVEEEIGLKGATALDPKILPQAAMVINLDSEEGLRYVFAGCAGGSRVSGKLDVGDRSEFPAGYVAMQITLNGLEGGHSGADIHLERGNANKLLASVLDTLICVHPETKMLGFIGGEAINSIPKKSQAQIAVPAELADRITSFFESKGRDLAFRFPKLQLHTETLQDPVPALREGVRNQVLNTLCGLPDGPLETEPGYPDRVLVSNNVGMVRTTEKNVSMSLLARAARLRKLEPLVEKLVTIMQGNGFVADPPISYEPWEEEQGAAAVQLVTEVIQQVTGVEPAVISVHAGLECGEVKKKFGPNAPSAVSIGPKIEGAHTQKERVLLQSVVEMFDILLKILEKTAA